MNPERESTGRDPQPGDKRTLHLPGEGSAMHFRWIPSGRFLMGSRGYDIREEPEHWVELTEGYWMAETPVTQRQFGIWTRLEKVEHQNHFQNKPDHPAENMTWFEAGRFCHWLSQLCHIQIPGFQATLPTEAQWEHACRADTRTEYYTGDGPEALDQAGWHDEALDSGSTHPVGLKAPNKYGLFDLHGNVWEWCFDAFVERVYRRRLDGGEDPMVLASKRDLSRVLRGGSWFNGAVKCRSASRIRRRPGARTWNDGFRPCLVRSPAVHPYEQKGLFRG